MLSAVGVIVDNFESLSLRGGHRPPAPPEPAGAAGRPGRTAAKDPHPRIQRRPAAHLALASLTLHPPQSARVLIKELNLTPARRRTIDHRRQRLQKS